MKDYSKLRPFDLKAAKAGAKLCRDDGESLLEFGTGPGCDSEVAVYDHRNSLGIVHPTWLRMVPLAWVRKSADEDVLWPVYKGDVLYVKNPTGRTGEVVTAEFRDNGDGSAMFRASNGAVPTIRFDNLTFTPPKVKREGWGVVLKDSLVFTKEEAEQYRNSQLGIPDRFVVVRAEWEE